MEETLGRLVEKALQDTLAEEPNLLKSASTSKPGRSSSHGTAGQSWRYRRNNSPDHAINTTDGSTFIGRLIESEVYKPMPGEEKYAHLIPNPAAMFRENSSNEEPPKSSPNVKEGGENSGLAREENPVLIDEDSLQSEGPLTIVIQPEEDSNNTEDREKPPEEPMPETGIAVDDEPTPPAQEPCGNEEVREESVQKSPQEPQEESDVHKDTTVEKDAPNEAPTSPSRSSAPPKLLRSCLLYTSPSPRDRQKSRMPSSA